MSTAAPEQTTRRPGDSLGTALVGVTLVLLLGIPSELIIKPLGAAGTPAQIAGVVLFVLWLGTRVMRWHRPRSLGAVGWLLLAFASALLLAYVAGASRPIRDAAEVTSSDRSMISLAAWCGIALAVAVGLGTLQQLRTVLRILAGGAVVVALVGILQFTVGLDVARLFPIPGLTANHPVASLILRSNFRRVTGTADHPIEFGVVLSSVLPLVVHFARFGADRAARRRWWVGAAVIAAALPMAVARSGMLGAAIVSLVVLPTLPARLRGRIVVAIGVGAFLMSFLVPGLLGTIRGLVLGASSDPSTQGRTSDYAPVLHYVSESPLLGRGPGTFIPSLYRTLDNQYLGSLVESGLIGLAALLALVLGSAGTALRARARSTDPQIRDLCVCLTAGLIAFAVNTATFDLFGFAMAVGVLFVLIGTVGAVARIARTPAGDADLDVVAVRRRSTAARPPTARERAVITTVITVLCCALPVLVAGAVIVRSHPGYLAVTTFVVEPPLPNGTGDVRAAGSADGAASVLGTAIDGPAIQQQLARAGLHDPTVVIGQASVMWGTDIPGYGPSMTVSVEEPTADAARAGARTVLDLARTTLDHLQDQAGVDPTVRLRLDDIVERSPQELHGRRSRAVAGLLVLAALMTGAAAGVFRRRRAGAGAPGGRHLLDAAARGAPANPAVPRALSGAAP